MRANLDAARSGNYVLDGDPEDPGFDCETSFGDGTSCTAEQLAAADLFGWHERLNDTTTGLPSVNAAVACTVPCETGSPYTITLRWDENRSGAIEADDPTLALQVVP